MMQVAEGLLLICSMFQDGSNFNISHRLLLGDFFFISSFTDPPTQIFAF